MRGILMRPEVCGTQGRGCRRVQSRPGCPRRVLHLLWAAPSTAALLDVQMDRSPKNGAGPVGRRVCDQPGAVEPAYQPGQRDLGFPSGQWAAETEVDAAAEPQVLVVTSIRVEAVRVVEAVRIAAA